MATYRSGENTMRAYAWTRVGETEQILHTHRHNGAGSCVTCGQPAPCNEMARAALLREHYRAWLDGARSWVDSGHVAAQIRPYVLVGNRSGDHAA